jgi:hypothetical protein
MYNQPPLADPRPQRIGDWPPMLAAVEMEIKATDHKLEALKKSAAILRQKIEKEEPFPPQPAGPQ